MDTLVELFASRVKAEVFRLLFGAAVEELHVREIARRARLNDATVRQELKRLTRLSLVVMRRDGNRAYYRANVLHPLYPDLRNLVLKTSGPVAALREPLTHPNVRLAFVFGSLATGTDQLTSDIDLIVIGDVSLRQVSKMLAVAAAEHGREINPHVLTVAEFSRRKRSGDHFVASVLAAPKLFVVGDEHELETMG